MVTVPARRPTTPAIPYIRKNTYARYTWDTPLASIVEEQAVSGHWYRIGCEGYSPNTCRVGDSELSVHRYFYIRQYGVIGRSQKLELTCGDDRCVNPAHIRITRRALPRPTIEDAAIEAVCRQYALPRLLLLSPARGREYRAPRRALCGLLCKLGLSCNDVGLVLQRSQQTIHEYLAASKELPIQKTIMSILHSHPDLYRQYRHASSSTLVEDAIPILRTLKLRIQDKYPQKEVTRIARYIHIHVLGALRHQVYYSQAYFPLGGYDTLRLIKQTPELYTTIVTCLEELGYPAASYILDKQAAALKY